MGRRSQTGKHYAYLAKLLNSLVVFIIMGVIGFAMLPSFLMPNLRSASAAKGLNSKVQPTKLSAIKKNRDYIIPSRSNTDLATASGVTQTAVLRDYERKKRVRKGSTS